MFHHVELGSDTIQRKIRLRELISTGKIKYGGNKRLKIYGTLNCSSGKKMKVENRVFFETEREAKEEGFRPCGHCLPDKYKR
jgi:methylphosphotriester-DNA--protein-cysteine methyltransferase